MRNILFGAAISPSLNPGLSKFRLKYPYTCTKAIFDYTAPTGWSQACKNILTDIASKQAPITARWGEKSVQLEDGMRLALESPELMTIYQELGRKGFQLPSKVSPTSQTLSQPYVWIPNKSSDQARQEFLEDVHELVNGEDSRELVINGLYMHHRPSPRDHKGSRGLKGPNGPKGPKGPKGSKGRRDPRDDYTFFMFEGKGSRPFTVRRIMPASPTLPVVDQRAYQPSAERVHSDTQHRPDENPPLIRKLYTPETAPGSRSVGDLSGNLRWNGQESFLEDQARSTRHDSGGNATRNEQESLPYRGDDDSRSADEKE